jgi:hypothetical protein
MATKTSVLPVSQARAAPLARSRRWPAGSVEAGAAIAATALYIGVTWWWLAHDNSIPVFDPGRHLSWAIGVYEDIGAGRLGHALTLMRPYPPFAYLIGALGMRIGGIGVTPAVLAENLLFVPLLALGCYHTGRLAFGRRAGLLAVAVALGTPLLVSQFHVFMVDAPETALVAVSVWLILAGERFSRPGVSAAAGVAVGLGMMTKEPFPFFVAGPVLVTLIRGGWRQWRGITAFVVPALAIALPWYVSELSTVHSIAQTVATSTAAGDPRGISPPRLSGANLTWYFWNILNFQLLLPLVLFALVGAGWLVFGLARRWPRGPFAWELAFGAFAGWLGITETMVHDIRYSMPLTVYLAAIGGGWIVQMRARPVRLAASGALALVALANVYALSFGVGTLARTSLPGADRQALNMPGVVTAYGDNYFLVGAPKRERMLPLMQSLHRSGVRSLMWIETASHEQPGFSNEGLEALAHIAKLAVAPEPFMPSRIATWRTAVLAHSTVAPNEPPPCITLSDRTGVWVRLGNPNSKSARDYCPYRHPAFYG